MIAVQADNILDGKSSDKIGEELTDRNAIGAWKVVMDNTTNEVYGTDWSWVEKGTNINNYGSTKYNWLLNYKTGELITLEDDSYIVLDNNTGLAVTGNLPLNINPQNLANQDTWGDNVIFHNEDKSTDSGVKDTEIKFDGKDDFLEVHANVNETDGMTFEFYGKNYKTESIKDYTVFMLNKTILDKNDMTWGSKFRTALTPSVLNCCFGTGNSGSDLVSTSGSHWVAFDKVTLSDENDYDYITININFGTGEVKVYSKGNLVQRTTCDTEYLKKGSLTDSEVPFTIGLQVGGGTRQEFYSKFDLYACRLYEKILTDSEIKDNYNKTVAYHNLLLDK